MLSHDSMRSRVRTASTRARERRASRAFSISSAHGVLVDDLSSDDLGSWSDDLNNINDDAAEDLLSDTSRSASHLLRSPGGVASGVGARSTSKSRQHGSAGARRSPSRQLRNNNNNNNSSRRDWSASASDAAMGGSCFFSRAQIAQLEALVAANPQKFSDIVRGADDMPLVAISNALAKASGGRARQVVSSATVDAIGIAESIINEVYRIAAARLPPPPTRRPRGDSAAAMAVGDEFAHAIDAGYAASFNYGRGGHDVVTRGEGDVAAHRQSIGRSGSIAMAVGSSCIAAPSAASDGVGDDGDDSNGDPHRQQHSAPKVAVELDDVGITAKQVGALIAKLGLLGSGFKRSLQVIGVVANAGDVALAAPAAADGDVVEAAAAAAAGSTSSFDAVARRRSGSVVSVSDGLDSTTASSSPQRRGSFKLAALATVAATRLAHGGVAAARGKDGEYSFRSNDPNVPNTGSWNADMFFACERVSQSLRKVGNRIFDCTESLRQRRRKTQTMVEIRHDVERCFAAALAERERRQQLQQPIQYEHRRCILDRVPRDVVPRLFGPEARLLRESRRTTLFVQLKADRTLCILRQIEQPVYGDGSGDRRLVVARGVVANGAASTVDDMALLREIDDAEALLTRRALESPAAIASAAAGAAAAASGAGSPRRRRGPPRNAGGTAGDGGSVNAFANEYGGDASFNMSFSRNAGLLMSSFVEVGDVSEAGLRDVAIQNCIEDERIVRCYEQLDQLRDEELTSLDTVQRVCTTAANLSLLVSALEADLTCPRCLRVIRQPHIIAPCGITVCRSCIVASDDQRLEESDPGCGDAARVECGCQYHEGSAVNRGIDTILSMWPEMRATASRLEGAVTEVAKALQREGVMVQSATAENLVKVRPKAEAAAAVLAQLPVEVFQARAPPPANNNRMMSY